MRRSAGSGRRLDSALYSAALYENPLARFDLPAEARAALVEMTRQYLLSQVAERDAKLAEIDRQRAQKEAERDTIGATVAKLKATIPIVQERADVRKYLFSRELGSKITYLTDMQELVGQQQDSLVQQSRYAEAQAAIAMLVESRNKAVIEYRRPQFEELAKPEQKAARLLQKPVKRQHRSRLQLLNAPVN